MQEVLWILGSFSFKDALDVTLVSLLILGVTYVIRGTWVASLLRAASSILALFVIASLFRFQALNWVIQNTLVLIAIAIPIIFQPELRRALERIGRGSLFVRNAQPEQREVIIQEIVKAAEKLTDRRHGALIVLARSSLLDEYIANGVAINSDVKAELLLTIFWPKTELHDGAVIIDQSGRIASAASVLPLSASRNLPNPKMGTRHRASIGISEVSDALCVVISEETGRISLTYEGRMSSRLDLDRLRGMLQVLYGLPNAPISPHWLVSAWQTLRRSLRQRLQRPTEKLDHA
jgi:diadenylate cyclase